MTTLLATIGNTTTTMKTLIPFLCAFVSLCGFLFSASAQSLSERLQKGLFEEEANHNLPAAIEQYKSVIAEADQQRRLAATAIFHLAESYRKLGREDEARPLYERILRDFSDQPELVARASARLPGRAETPHISDIQIPKPSHNFDALDQLIKNSPDLLNAPATNDMTFLQRAAMKGDIELIEFLIDRGAMIDRAAPKFSQTPLMYAVMYGHKRAAELLIKAGANVNYAESGNTPLTIAAGRGYLELTSLLLESGADVNLATPNGYTPLHTAAGSGHAQVIRLLADAGANLDVMTGLGTPLASAVYKDQPEAITVLLKAGANPNLFTRGVRSPLFFALRFAFERGSREVFDALMNSTNINLNAVDQDGSTALMLAVDYSLHDAVETLVKRGANLNATNSLGYTALHRAVTDDSALQMLLEAGADPNIPNKSGHTPLHLAAGAGRLLGTERPGPNVSSFSSDGYYFQHGRVMPDKIELLLKHNADPNLQDFRGNTPLHFAVENSSAEAVNMLLKANADPNRKDSQGQTPLDWAHRHPPQFQDLLKQAGATNSAPETPQSPASSTPTNPPL